MPTLPAPRLAIDPLNQRGQTVDLSVGDVFAVSVPPRSSTWKVDFSDMVVQSLIPAEEMQSPGAQGWLFRAVAAGQTDIRLTAVAPACNQPQPCPPAPPVEFVFTVNVR